MDLFFLSRPRPKFWSSLIDFKKLNEVLFSQYGMLYKLTITLHYIAIHYITLHYITNQLFRQLYRPAWPLPPLPFLCHLTQGWIMYVWFSWFNIKLIDFSFNLIYCDWINWCSIDLCPHPPSILPHLLLLLHLHPLPHRPWPTSPHCRRKPGKLFCIFCRGMKILDNN